jgi:hypothetical protein
VILELLRRLEKNPLAVFYERELKKLDAAQFDLLRGSGVLRRVVCDPVGSMVLEGPSPRLLTVAEGPGGELEAFDEEDPFFEPVRIREQDVIQVEVDLRAIAREFRLANGLQGEFEEITKRLYFLGHAATREDTRVAALLGLFSDQSQFQAEASALPARLPGRYSRFVVACPSAGIPPSIETSLEALGVHVLLLNERDPFVLSKRAAALFGFGQDGSGEQPARFVHDPDYRSVTLDGVSFTLSPRQAAAVRILHRAHRAGTPDLPWEAIKGQLEAIDYYPDRMHDVFKSVANWKALVRSDKRGFFRLNL